MVELEQCAFAPQARRLELSRAVPVGDSPLREDRRVSLECVAPLGRSLGVERPVVRRELRHAGKLGALILGLPQSVASPVARLRGVAGGPERRRVDLRRSISLGFHALGVGKPIECRRDFGFVEAQTREKTREFRALLSASLFRFTAERE